MDGPGAAESQPSTRSRGLRATAQVHSALAIWSHGVFEIAQTKQLNTRLGGTSDSGLPLGTLSGPLLIRRAHRQSGRSRSPIPGGQRPLEGQVSDTSRPPAKHRNTIRRRATKVSPLFPILFLGKRARSCQLSPDV
ncbi:hypothetical protein AAFF_G00332300 [Aldrovandia affinis]|uniref:Uncharacterized protein n=1 Tax=Aldrovandia affinis TaxID=143900 RepID=A0AAD7SLS7_9TELE|nr:hypothetical protein AAFF_G00332300 [Aldrovandia affinis]